VFILISDHVILLDFRKHLVILLLPDEIDVHIDHLVILAVDIDGIQSGMVIVVDQ
jgi:hypothetical protein